MAFDLQIGAATIFMEASGEPPEGQRAIAHCLVNRMKDGRWGATLAAVCLCPEQFSCWNTHDGNRHRLAITPDNNIYLQAAQQYIASALAGGDPDPSNGALYYFNPSIVMPVWASGFKQTAVIGHHTFFTDR